MKRNGVEVRSSQSDVCIFLREEVCAISDHLGEVSKFTAEDWLAGLAYFNGWTNSSPEYEECLRKSVSTQKLKSFEEPSDVNSTLLKSQIDEQFLKAMEAAKLQMRAGNTYHSQARSKPHLGRIDEASSSNHGVRSSFLFKSITEPNIMSVNTHPPFLFCSAKWNSYRHTQLSSSSTPRIATWIDG